MSRTLRAVAGGLLSGVGQGMVAQAISKRDQMLAQMRQQHETKMQDRRFAHESGLLNDRQTNALALERERQWLMAERERAEREYIAPPGVNNILPNEQGGASAVMDDGSTRPLEGLLVPRSGGGNSGGMNDNQILSNAIEQYTTVDELGQETVDQAGVRHHLSEVLNRPDLAAHIVDPAQRYGVLGEPPKPEVIEAMLDDIIAANGQVDQGALRDARVALGEAQFQRLIAPRLPKTRMDLGVNTGTVAGQSFGKSVQ